MMPDREKVKKGLECCLTLDSPCGDCPYYSYEDIQELDCERNLRHDAIALLKEQDAKIGHWISIDDFGIVAIDDDGLPARACFCSECKKYLIASDEYLVYGRFCPFCGAKMEGR